MYHTTITLATPFVDNDKEPFFEIDQTNKKDVRKVERALIRGLMHLSNLADDAADNAGGIFAGSDPQEVHLVYLVEKDGVKWTKATHEWPNQTDQARAYLTGMLDQLMKDVGHLDKKQTRKAAKRK